MCVNSTPVTPEPMTTMCSGSSGGGYAWRVVSTRSPSTGANSGTRGREPVATTTKSASSSSMPVGGLDDDLVRPLEPAGAAEEPDLLRLEQVHDRVVQALPRSTRPARGARRGRRRPRPAGPSRALRPSSASSPPVAIIAFDGMQSHRWAAPPMTSRSTSVTSAPSVAATVAHVLPAGPPPRITSRTPEMRVTHPGYGTPLACGSVPELRHDELSGRWVLLAPGRAARPHTFPASALDARARRRDCPFCPGNEHDDAARGVPHRAAARPTRPGWRVRVVPNLYPIVGGDDAGPGATGAHEVVVLSPAHEALVRPARRANRRPRCSPSSEIVPVIISPPVGPSCRS